MTRGLTWNGVAWAFTQPCSANWHPLTWLSHMLDCQIYHRDDQPYQQAAGGHHLTSVLLHAAAAVLLLLVLLKMTGRLWPSAWVAAVFALHPLHVESVAWIAERKDVLSGVFFMLTLWAYADYARRPALWRYAAVLALFALGLMAKPMLVTLPFVLLLLDYWPLGRFAAVEPRQAGPDRARALRRLGWLLVEKLPMLALAAVSCRLTIWAQAQVHALKTTDELSWCGRISNAILSYVAYLGQTFWPANLAAFYPHLANRLVAWQVVLAALLLAAISAAVLLAARKRRYLLVGWLWYLGMLVPVIGLVQVGAQGRADRYMYLPQIGLAIAIAWGAAELTKIGGIYHCSAAAPPRPCSSPWHGVPGCKRAIGTTASRSGPTPSNSTSTTDNDFAHHNLGIALAANGDTDKATEHYQEAIRINAPLRRGPQQPRYSTSMPKERSDARPGRTSAGRNLRPLLCRRPQQSGSRRAST